MLAAAVVLVAVGCAGDDDDGSAATTTRTGAAGLGSVPADSVIPAEDASTPTIPAPAGFVPPDTRNVRLRPVVGKRQPEPDLEANLVPVDGGDSELTVRVVDQDGKPVRGADVRLERFVGPFKGWDDTTTGRDGSVVVGGLRGGRFRVRAWVAPRLATTEPQLVFLTAGEKTALTVRIDPHEGFLVQGAFLATTWQVDDSVVFDTLLVQEEVGTDGIIRGRPVIGAVTLAPVFGLWVDGESTKLTDAAGHATFIAVCGATGVHEADVEAAGSFPARITLPECLPRDPNRPPADTTTTTVPDGSTTTSTTTPDGAIDIGDTFTVPYDEQLPVGTYQAVGGTTCVTRLELFVDGGWAERVFSGTTINAVSPIRRLVAADGTEPCTYRRTK